MAELPNLGLCTAKDSIWATSYIVSSPGRAIVAEERRLLNGKLIYLYDLALNPHGFVFQPGGRHADDILIAGTISRLTGNDEATANFSGFGRLIAKACRSVRGNLVAPEAYKLLEEGTTRLAYATGEPSFSDLHLTSAS